MKYDEICKILPKEIGDVVNKYLNDDVIQEMSVVQKLIDNIDTYFAEEIIKKYIATMIFVEITDAGYIVYNIPESWGDITFHTTGLDITLNIQQEYGHLVLSY